MTVIAEENAEAKNIAVHASHFLFFFDFIKCVRVLRIFKVFYLVFYGLGYFFSLLLLPCI